MEKKETSFGQPQQTETMEKKETSFGQPQQTETVEKKETSFGQPQQTETMEKKETSFGQPKQTEIMEKKETSFGQPQQTETMEKKETSFGQPQQTETVEKKETSFGQPQQTETMEKKETSFGQPQQTETVEKKETSFGQPQQTETVEKKETSFGQPQQTETVEKKETSFGQPQQTETMEKKETSFGQPKQTEKTEKINQKDDERKEKEKDKEYSNQDEETETMEEKDTSFGQWQETEEIDPKDEEHTKKEKDKEHSDKDEETETMEGKILSFQPQLQARSKRSKYEEKEVIETRNIFKSDRNMFLCVKFILGLMGGLFSGGVLFAVLVFSFGYSYTLAGYISGGFTIVSCIALALSVHARCIIVLVIPSLFTSRGRVAILAVIFGLLLSRPIANISNNAGEVSRSMACSTELFHNQSFTLRQQLQVPVEKVKAALTGQEEKIRDLKNTIENILRPLTKFLNSVNDAFSSAGGKTAWALQECERIIGGAYQKCVSGIRNARDKCNEAMEDIKRNTKGFLKLKFLCRILKIDGVCNIVKPSFLCSPVRLADNVVQSLGKKISDVVNEINRWFQVGVTNKESAGQVYKVSKSAQELISEVKAALARKQMTFLSVIEYFNKCLALSLILLLLQSFLYLKRYLSKNDYDNIYITSNFRKLDEEYKKRNEPTVLPLRKKEKSMYTYSLSPLISAKERQEIIMGVVTLVLHMLLTALILFIDHILFYILYLVRRYGEVNVEFTGQHKINLRVKGGIMAQFINKFLENINIQSSYESNYDTSICLPDPKSPDLNDIPILGVIYGTALLFVIMQTYGSRLNHKICAYYYPEQERERIVYLHKKILYNRKKESLFMRQRVKSLHTQKAAEEKMSIRGLLARLFRRCHTKEVELKYCAHCGKNEDNQAKLVTCRNKSCAASCCPSCYEDFINVCPLCALPSSTAAKIF